MKEMANKNLEHKKGKPQDDDFHWDRAWTVSAFAVEQYRLERVEREKA